MMGQVAYRHPPGLADGGGSAGQRDIFEMSGAFEILIAGDEHFSAPYLSVGAEAGAIEGKANHAAFEMVLDHAAGDVSVMVLHADQLHSTLPQSPFGRKVIRVQIIGDDLRLDFKNAFEVLDGLVEEGITFDIFQIANVLAQERMLALGEADGVLKFASHGQHRREIVFEEDWNRDKPARTPQLSRDPARNPHHRIIAAEQDVAIVDEEAIGKSVQPMECFKIIDGNRFLAQVAAGHHQSFKSALRQQQVVQRSVGKKNAQVTIAGRNCFGDCARPFFQKQNNRPWHRLQNRGCRMVQFADFRGGRQIGNHHRERLFHPTLPLTQSIHGSRDGGIDGEMETAQTLDCDNLRGKKPGSGICDRVGTFDDLSRPIPEFDARAALPASVGLGMKTPVERIFVFRQTCRAHRKRRHRGARPVIRDIANDGKARSAVGAIDEGIAIATVARVEHFTHAIRADRDVRRNEGANFFALAARHNAKVVIEVGGQVTARQIEHGDTGDAGQGRSFGGQAIDEILHRLRRALDLDGDSGGGIANRTAQAALGGETIDVRAESDSLHDAGDVDLAPNFHTASACRLLRQSVVRLASLGQPHHPLVETIAHEA